MKYCRSTFRVTLQYENAFYFTNVAWKLIKTTMTIRHRSKVKIELAIVFDQP